MAEKQRGKSLKQLKKKSKSWFACVYECGVWHSTVFHTIFLLLLSFIVTSDKFDKPIRIALSFTPSNEMESINFDRIQQIEIQSTLVENDSFHEFEKIKLSEAIDTKIDLALDESKDIESISGNNVSIKDLIKPITPNNLYNRRIDFIAEGAGGVSNISHEPSDIIESIATSVGNRSGQNSSRVSGLGDELGKRLSGAGAKSGDIQISMMWNTTDDIDLHVSYTPGNGLVDNINWTNRIGKLSSGLLDIDMNANSGLLTNTPVENIFWPKGSSPKGFFVVYIHFYRSWTGNNKVPVMVRIKIGNNNNDIKALSVLYQSPQEIYRFKFPN